MALTEDELTLRGMPWYCAECKLPVGTRRPDGVCPHCCESLSFFGIEKMRDQPEMFRLHKLTLCDVVTEHG